MFLRRKSNTSGTVSVQGVEKRDGKYVVLQNFGAKRLEKDILSLEAKALEWMSRQQGPKIPFSFERDEIVESFVGSLSNGQLQVVGLELVYGSLYKHMALMTVTLIFTGPNKGDSFSKR